MIKALHDELNRVPSVTFTGAELNTLWLELSFRYQARRDQFQNAVTDEAKAIRRAQMEEIHQLQEKIKEGF